MINESDESQESQSVDDSSADPMLGQFEGLIGGAIEKAVSQYRALLMQGLETEVKRIVADFEVATTDVDQAVANQTRSRLSELVEGEVRAVFDDTLGDAEQTFADPIWRTARDMHIPHLAPKKPSEDEASIPSTPAQTQSADHDRVSQPEAPESERENVDGPKPIAAPSPNFWVFPSDQQMRVRVQEEPEPGQPSPSAFEEAQQPTDDDEQYTDAISAIVGDNSDLDTVIHDNTDVVHIAHDEDQKRDPVDDPESVPVEEFDDEGVIISEASDFEDFEAPDWDLPNSPLEMPDDSSMPDPNISEEEIETAEAVVAETSDGEQAEYDSVVEEEATDPPADEPRTDGPVSDSEEEEPVPVVEQAEAEVAAHADAIGEVGQEAQAEPVAVVAEEPTQEVDEPQKVISDVESDVETVAEQSQDLIVEHPPTEATDLNESVEPENDQAAVFEGTVRLNVEAPGCVREIVQFVRELRQKPQLRLLRLVGNNKEGVDIWLGLREPLSLGTILPEMQGVTIISKSLDHVGGPDERLLSVRLIRDEAPQNPGALVPAEPMPVENPKVVA